MNAGRALLCIVPCVGALVAAPNARAQARGDSLAPALTLERGASGVAASVLRDVLARPHTTVVAPDTGIVLGRATDVATTLVVVGGPVRLEGHVRGDVLVLGDLVLRPGAVIEGRAIAIGGHVVNSSLATFQGERLAFLDVDARMRRSASGAMVVALVPSELQPVPLFALPGIFGIRLASYDRVGGVSLPFGPEVALFDARLRIDPAVTYRSQLGAVDPSVAATFESRRYEAEAHVGRGTFTNEMWIRSDLANSAATLFAGSDARNYYRADRADVSVGRMFESKGRTLTPFLGALVERAWSAARDSNAASVPYSLFNQNDGLNGMRRLNPAVTGGTISSVIGGVRLRSYVSPIIGAAELKAELPVHTSLDAHFVQLTLDGRLGFPTFKDQRFDAFAHGVATLGDRPPSQRFAYVGGGGTIPTLELLERGGDQLAWLESRYTAPINRVHLPLVGSPTIVLRHLVGGAGVDRVGTLTQNVGLRIGIAAVRAEFIVDPEHTNRHEFAFGFGVR